MIFARILVLHKHMIISGKDYEKIYNLNNRSLTGSA